MFGAGATTDPSSGLKAVWQAEVGFSLDEKENNRYFASRDTYIGLDSKLGKLLIGRTDTPFKDLSGKTDMFRDQIGDSRNLTMPGGYQWDIRPDNSIRYTTPKCPNDSGSKYAMSGEGHGDVVIPVVGNDPSGFSLGMIYKF